MERRKYNEKSKNFSTGFHALCLYDLYCNCKCRTKAKAFENQRHSLCGQHLPTKGKGNQAHQGKMEIIEKESGKSFKKRSSYR